MAVDAYVAFKGYDDKYIPSESTTDWSKNKEELAADLKTAAGQNGIFEIDSYSFGVSQTLNIGSQSGGAGAGKIDFGTFTISRKVDKSSPLFFTNCCAGKPFKQVILGMRKAAGQDASGVVFLRYDFKLVAVQSISWSGSNGAEAPYEQVSFEYGGLIVNYAPQKSDGTLASAIPGGWNRVKNTSDTVLTAPIA